jgi:hypothetical protein
LALHGEAVFKLPHKASCFYTTFVQKNRKIPRIFVWPGKTSWFCTVKLFLAAAQSQLFWYGFCIRRLKKLEHLYCCVQAISY